MQDMSEKFDDLPPGKAQRIAETLGAQQREGTSAIAELDKRLTHTNLLTNGGGAIALLTYLGTGADFWYVKIALTLFTIGLIATGIELRSLLNYWYVLTKDAGRRHRGFLFNELTVKDCTEQSQIGKTHMTINNIAGWVSQSCFILGVLVVGFGFFILSHPITSFIEAGSGQCRRGFFLLVALHDW